MRDERMNRYRHDPEAIRALVRPDAVHRDVYLSQELFDLEMERLWRDTWIYVGHDSQVPAAGDYYTTELARQPVILLRDEGGEVRVLMNRCAHKGARLLSASSGHCEKNLLRCPYHGWTYRLDGSIRTIPLKGGYEGTALAASPNGRGVVALPDVVNYRGFVFARLNPQGPGFEEYFGASLSSIDNLVDRSPEGRLEVAGGVLRYMHDSNWKMFIENLNDTMHPMVAHESAAGTALQLRRRRGVRDADGAGVRG
jgi:benzoate/toluate 1,2-dioxygenase alpha subunit